MRKLLLVGLTGALIGLALACWAYGAADESLVLQLSFDENTAVAQDSSGYQNNGTVVGATWAESGIVGGGIALDGVDDYIDCGTGESLNIGASDFTIQLWLKTAATDKWQPVIGNGGRGQGHGVFDITARPENTLGVGYTWNRPDDGAHEYKGRGNGISVWPINDGRWHHVAVVVDRDHAHGVPRLYVDGTEDTLGPTSSRGDAEGMLITNRNPLFIGANSPKAERFFQGLIDEVRMYTRALTDVEIKTHYDAEKTLQEPPGLIPPEAHALERGGYLLLHNNRISIAFDKARGVPGAVRLLPQGYLLMPMIWRGSVAHQMVAENLAGENISGRVFQTSHRGEITFATEEGQGYAQVSAVVHRVDNDGNPFIRINYIYRLQDDKPYVEADYTITALRQFKTGGSAFHFELRGDTVVYQDEYGYIEARYLNTGWAKERVEWEEDIAVDNFWMASRKSQGKYSVGILRPGESNLREYLFSGQYFFFSLPRVFSGVVENSTSEQINFYIVAIHRASVDDQRAEIDAFKSLLADLK